MDFSNRQLFAAGGPSSRDIRQGAVGDCWLMAGLGAAAQSNANSIRQTVADCRKSIHFLHFGRLHLWIAQWRRALLSL
jgi:hypothetical protein